MFSVATSEEASESARAEGCPRRPDDVMLMKDGSILISDDWNGAIYRVSYGKSKVAAQ